MKGQAINIDFTIALALFLVSTLSGILILTDNDALYDSTEELEGKIFDVRSEIEDSVYVEGRKSSLVTRTPFRITNVPVDRKYIFPGLAYPGSGAMSIPAEVNITENRIVTVTDLNNNSQSMIYFFHDNENLSYSNDIQVGQNISNSYITASPGGNGLDSLEVDGNEVLSSSADLNSTNDTVVEHELHVETLDENLKVYNNSPEMIIETDGTLNLRNFTEIYWDDNGTENLEPGETYSGETQGFALASVDGESEDYGIAFMGDMNAEVSKQSGTVLAEIDASEVRVRLFVSDIGAGRERVKAHTDGRIFFTPLETVKGASPDKLEELENMTENEFEEELELQNFNYNITLGRSKFKINRGSSIPVNQNVIVSDLGAVLLDRKGNASLMENQVALWR